MPPSPARFALGAILLGTALGACVLPLDDELAGDEPVDSAAFALAGDLEPGFGTGGFRMTEIDVSAQSVAYAVARQGDGKLITAGEAWNGARYVGVVARVNADGSRDPSFAVRGWVAFDLSTQGYDLSLRGVLVQPDGKIVAVGRASTASGAQTVIFATRLHADGSIDAGFGDKGTKLVASTSHSYAAHAVALQADGRLVLAGARWSTTGATDVLIARLGAAGQLDGSFDGDGLRFVDAGATDVASGVAVQADGKIVFGGTRSGTFTGGSDSHMLAGRLNASGTLDASFSGDGLAMAVLSDRDTADALVLQPDGKLVLVGKTTPAGASLSDFALARFTTTGAQDTSFSGDGEASFAVIPGSDAALGVSVTSGGQLLVVGWANQSQSNLMAARVTAAGALDTSFDGDGVRTASFGLGAALYAVTLQPDGRAVGVGTRYDAVDSRMALARFNTSGALDANFDGDGRATVMLGYQERALASAVQPDGRFIAVGYASDGFRDLCAVARYTAAGALDSSFGGGDGKLTFLFDGAGCRLDAAVVQADGRIVVADGFKVARLTAAGAFDTSFDGDGKKIIVAGEGSGGEGDLALATDGSGKLWVGGTITQLGVPRLGVARLNANGSLDTSYSGDGWTTAYFNGQSHALAKIVPYADNRVLVLGEATDLGPLVTRLTASGSIEGGFGVGGRQLLGVGGATFGENATALLVAPDGKIVTLGNTVDGIGVGRIVVTQLLASGAFDTGFGPSQSGRRIVQPMPGSVGAALVRQSDGKLVVAGRGVNGGTLEQGALFVRFNASGALDANYGGGDGWAVHAPGVLSHVTDLRLVPGTNHVLAAGYDSLTPPPAGGPISRGDQTAWDFLVMRVQAQ